MSNQVELLGDLLWIAGDELESPAVQLLPRISLAVFERTDDLSSVEAAATVGAWIIRNRPFPKANREIGYRYMRLMLKHAEAPWPRPEEDAKRITAMLRALEAGVISEAKFVDWVCVRVATA